MIKLKNVINKHKSNKIKENSNTVRHLNNGTDHRHSKSCCDQSSPARRTIKNNAWVTVNNYFWVTSEAICQWFSWVTRSRGKILGKLHHEWHKNCPGTQFCEKPSSITHFATVAKDGLFWLRIVTSPQLICDVTRTRDTSIVMSYSSIVFAHANWRKGDLH